jgi:hypothetical protein
VSTEQTDIAVELKALFAEIRAADAAGDDPRYNRAVYALRRIYCIEIVEPRTAGQRFRLHLHAHRYADYRPTDSDLESAIALVANLVAALEAAQ